MKVAFPSFAFRYKIHWVQREGGNRQSLRKRGQGQGYMDWD